MAYLLRFPRLEGAHCMKEEPRVLIVEHDDIVRVMLFTILRHQPLAVDTAATAEAAMEKIRVCDYALIIVDANLPDNDCDRFVQMFREERPELKTFILVVRNPNIDFVPSERVDAVLNKPLEVDTLAEVVRECALIVPQPEDSAGCPPAESDIRTRLDRTPMLSN